MEKRSNCIKVEDECKDIFEIYKLDYSEDSFELEYKKYDKLVKDDLKNLPYYKTNLCYRTYNKYKSNK